MRRGRPLPPSRRWRQGRPGFPGLRPGDGGRRRPYRFRTIRPVAYSGRTPHIHVKVKLASRELLTTQLYVAGDPDNERDFLWRNLGPEARAALTVPFEQGSDGLRANFPIVRGRLSDCGAAATMAA